MPSCRWRNEHGAPVEIGRRILRRMRSPFQFFFVHRFWPAEKARIVKHLLVLVFFECAFFLLRLCVLSPVRRLKCCQGFLLGADCLRSKPDPPPPPPSSPSPAATLPLVVPLSSFIYDMGLGDPRCHYQQSSKLPWRVRQIIADWNDIPFHDDTPISALEAHSDGSAQMSTSWPLRHLAGRWGIVVFARGPATPTCWARQGPRAQLQSCPPQSCYLRCCAQARLRSLFIGSRTAHMPRAL